MQEALDIVVVDDSEDVREFLEVALQFEGHRVQSFGSASDALEHISTHPTDALYTDLTMPEMSGVELIDAVLAKRFLPRENIFAITGLSFDSADVRWLTGRQICVLFKPLHMESLLWSLENVCRRQFALAPVPAI